MDSNPATPTRQGSFEPLALVGSGRLWMILWPGVVFVEWVLSLGLWVGLQGVRRALGLPIAGGGVSGGFDLIRTVVVDLSGIGKHG